MFDINNTKEKIADDQFRHYMYFRKSVHTLEFLPQPMGFIPKNLIKIYVCPILLPIKITFSNTKFR